MIACAGAHNLSTFRTAPCTPGPKCSLYDLILC